jgi:hypothetical protein
LSPASTPSTSTREYVMMNGNGRSRGRGGTRPMRQTAADSTERTRQTNGRETTDGGHQTSASQDTPRTMNSNRPTTTSITQAFSRKQNKRRDNSQISRKHYGPNRSPIRNADPASPIAGTKSFHQTAHLRQTMNHNTISLASRIFYRSYCSRHLSVYRLDFVDISVLSPTRLVCRICWI